MSALIQAWKAIENWLDTEAASVDSNIISKGLSAVEITAFETSMSIHLPDTFRASYMIHNGFNEAVGLFHGADLLTLAAIKQHYFRLIDKFAWDSKMLPFLMYNEYAFICLHLDSFQIYDCDIVPETGIFTAEKMHFKNLEEMVIAIAKDLQEGNGCMGELLC